MAFTKLNTAVDMAGPGGSVLLLADKGPYNAAGTITLTNGGTDAAPVTIKGVSSAGTAMDVQIYGTRAPVYSVATADSGGDVFRLLSGADNLKFEGMDFYNVENAFRVGANIRNLSIQNMEADNIRYFLYDIASGTNGSATISGLTVRDVEVHGFSKGVIKLKYDTNNVLIEDVFGDSEYLDGDGLAMGVHLDGTVHNVVIRDTTMLNAIATGATGDYWNGDGFATERGVYNVRFENTLAAGNGDGGYDLKSTGTVLINAVAENNARNFRLWGEATLINPTGIDPHKRGGSGSQDQIQLLEGAKVTVSGGQFVDSGSITKVIVNSSGGTIKFTDTDFTYAGTLTIGGNIFGLTPTLIDKVSATGTYSKNGEIYLDGSASPTPTPTTPPTTGTTLTGTSGGDVMAPTAAGNWTIDGRAGNDSITTLTGNDVLTGGAGDDTISAGSGSDTIVYAGTDTGFDVVNGGTGSDRIVAKADGTVIGLHGVTGVEAISSGGFGGVTISGGAAADVLDFSRVSLSGITAIKGGAGNDTITGSAAADVIVGGTGGDLLRGGAGRDTFDYNSIGEAAVGERILDFAAGIDRIDLSGIDANASVAGNQALRFINQSSFSKTAGELRIDRSDSSVTKLIGDINGDGIADFTIALSGQHNLTAGDFIL